MSDDLTPESFLTWLNTFADDDIVGEYREPDNCPLAQWSKYSSIGETIWWSPSNEEEIMPIWAQNFRYLCDNDSESTFVTAKQCKDWLQRSLSHQDKWSFPELKEIK